MTTDELIVAVSDGRSQIGINRTGLALSLVLGAVHLLWAILVAAGVAQPVMDFIFQLHFIRPVYVIEPFSFIRALALVLLTAASGYCIGVIFALLWNRFHR